MNRKELFPLLVKAMNDIYTCYRNNFKLSDIQDYLNNDVECDLTNYISSATCCVNLWDFNNLTNKFKEIIADFAGINTQQNDKDPTDQTVYLAVEALVKAYGLKSPEELLEKVKELTGNSSNSGQPDDSFEQFQPAIHAFMDAYDIDTAAAFNTKIYQLIASDIQDSKTNSDLQQQLAALCNQVETLTGQVQQLSEQIQQLKNPPTKSE